MSFGSYMAASKRGLPAAGVPGRNLKQLIRETRAPIPMRPGRPARHDYEYERNGTPNLFMFLAPLEGWRRVEVSDRRAALDQSTNEPSACTLKTTVRIRHAASNHRLDPSCRIFCALPNDCLGIRY